MMGRQKEMSAALFASLYNGGDEAVIERVVHPKYVQKPIGYSGHEGIRRHAAELRAAFPDLSLELVDQIGENDGVVNLVLLTGRHEGALWGQIPASGNAVMVMTVVIHRYEQGRIVEGVVIIDQLSLLQQIGFLPTPVWAGGEER